MQKLKSEESDTLILLKSWLLQYSFSSLDLIPTNFPITGRGLKTLRDIRKNEILVKLPIRMLITTSTMSDCDIKVLFSKNRSYNAHYILSIFIIYEEHLETLSKWYPYIKSLPRYFSTPTFCTPTEKKYLPIFIKDQEHKIAKDFILLIGDLDLLKEKEKNYCPHCNIPLDKIITFNKYKWAYYAVNTRSVYINEKEIPNNVIKVESPNNLALAPFLDLFNHDIKASVEVSVTMDEHKNKFYQINTLKSFEKNSQVFINYGPHSSLKLYTDYGFFIPNNPLDEVGFTILDIQSSNAILEYALKFILTNKFNENMAFTRDGLNYNATNTLFIVSTDLEKDCWNSKIYGSSFSLEDYIKMYKLGKQILHLKRKEYFHYLANMNNIKKCSSSFLTAVNLVKEYIQILDESLKKLNVANEVM